MLRGVASCPERPEHARLRAMVSVAVCAYLYHSRGATSYHGQGMGNPAVELLHARCQRGPIRRGACLCLCNAQRLDRAFDRGFGLFLSIFSLESDRLFTENDSLSAPLWET